MKKWLKNLFILFFSTGTLICCVIPAVLVMLGLGASLASFLQVFPEFITISQYKWEIFIFVGLLLSFNFYIIKKQSNQVCEVGEVSDNCEEVKYSNNKIFIVSCLIYLFSLGFNLFALI